MILSPFTCTNSLLVQRGVGLIRTISAKGWGGVGGGFGQLVQGGGVGLARYGRRHGRGILLVQGGRVGATLAQGGHGSSTRLVQP